MGLKERLHSSHPRHPWRRRLVFAVAAIAAAALGHSLLVMAAPRNQVAVFRPSTGEWFVRADDQNAARIPFGAPGDVPVARDYESRGQVQIAVFRPSTREWFIRSGSGGTVGPISFGGPDDMPIPGDYLGLGRAQIAVFRPSTGEWFIRRDDGSTSPIQFGGPGDQPVPADYFGSGRIQIAVYRPSTGEWFLRTDSGGTVPIPWGGPGDKPVPGDYFGLRRAQIAVFRPSTGEWILRNDDGSGTSIQWGGPADQAIAGDYDGIGRMRIAVYRPETQEWFLRNDDGSAARVQWGGPGDVPVPAAFGIATAGPPPVSPPAAPSNLVAAANSSTQIMLTWADNSTDETGFKVERKTGGGSYAEIASLGANVTTYADGGLTPSTAYTYRVRAVNAGGASAYSNEAGATTQAPPPTAPAPPSNLVAAANSTTQVTLTWADNSNDETGFRVERKSGTGSYAEIASVGANVTTYADSGLTPATGYTYRVRAVNSGGFSAYSNEASATTQSPPAALSLDKDIQPIFTQRCALAGCHAGNFPQEGMNLSSGKAFASIVNVDSQEVPSKKRVKPGDPDNSFLVEKISSDSPAGGGTRMPQASTPLPQDQIDKIRMWIQQGANP